MDIAGFFSTSFFSSGSLSSLFILSTGFFTEFLPGVVVTAGFFSSFFSATVPVVAAPFSVFFSVSAYLTGLTTGVVKGLTGLVATCGLSFLSPSSAF